MIRVEPAPEPAGFDAKVRQPGQGQGELVAEPPLIKQRGRGRKKIGDRREDLSGDIRLDYLERRAPFIARELRRQGKLRAGDA